MLMLLRILVMSLNLNLMPKLQTKLVMLPSPKMSMLMLIKGRRRKQLIPINLKWMMLPSASQGANGIPTTSNIDIILQKIANRMMKGSI